MKQNLIKLEQNCDKTYVLISGFRASIISIRKNFYFCSTKAKVSSGKISVIVTHYTVLYDFKISSFSEPLVINHESSKNRNLRVAIARHHF